MYNAESYDAAIAASIDSFQGKELEVTNPINPVVRFWGVRGSVASPQTSAMLRQKFEGLLLEFLSSGSNDVEAFLKAQTAIAPFTYGGNRAVPFEG